LTKWLGAAAGAPATDSARDRLLLSRNSTVAEDKSGNEPTIVERWLEDQQQWQRTVLAYLDSMTKNDDFLVHLGNAMRGSLLAGKPYPTPPASPGAQTAALPAEPPALDERLDKVLFALHQLQGQVADLQFTLDEMRDGRARNAASVLPVPRTRTPAKAASSTGKKAATRKAPARPAARTRKRKGRA
jgi:hypothetical protein